jgi:amino acid adenylation domain-containing protein
MYTSGSTGKPKGAMLHHQGICNRLLWMRDLFQMSPADCLLHKASLNFDASIWEIFVTLLSGARLVIMPTKEELDNAALVQQIIRQQVTTLHFTPAMLQIFLETAGVETCTSLRQVWSGGDILSAAVVEKFYVRLTAKLYNGYGPTETSINATCWPCPRAEVYPQTVPIGRPIANNQIYLLDSHLQPVPIGVPGEIYIGGVGVGYGYLNRLELTAEKFIPNPFHLLHSSFLKEEPGSRRLYKTGDLARYRPGGNIEFLGRLDYQVKLRGIRVELGEIEATLTPQAKLDTFEKDTAWYLSFLERVGG